jgi:hypothetical protein
MTRPPTLGDFWAEAFTKPSKLWRPARNWKPQEWTPFPAVLDRLLGRTGLDIACFDLQAHLVTGRIKAVLQHLYETREDLVQPPPRRRGPPTKKVWLDICGEIARRCIDPKSGRLRVPENESALSRDVLQWLEDRDLGQPADSEMRDAVRRICAALRAVQK